MSVLLAFVTAIAAKLIPPDVEATQLKAEIDALKRERDEARAENQRLIRSCETWEALALSWRRRYEQLVEPQMQAAQQQMAQLMLNQVMAQQANLPAQYQQSLLGAQNLGQHLTQQMGWCNCVPARHDMLLRSGSL